MSNITCYDSDNNVLETLYQWDDNQTIRISGLDIPSHPVFHFCNRLSKYALIVNPTISGSDLVVKIPNSLLQQAETIFAYLYQDTQDGGHRTSHAIKIPVKSRLKPSTDEEGEIDVIEEAERRGAAAQKATDCLEIAESLTTCDELNGFTEIVDYASMDWQNLRNQIEGTLILTDEKQAELQSYSEIRSAAAQTENKNPVEIINVWKLIEREVEVATDYIPLLSQRMGTFSFTYSVPYLKTKNVTSLSHSAFAILNTNCVGCGFDCSSMDGNGLTTGMVSFFSGVNVPGNPNLQYVKLTNMQSVTNCKNLFYNCSALKTVDLDGLQATNLYNIFARCSSLETIALSNSVINDSLNLTASVHLTQDSVVAVLAATADNVSNKTITFNSAVQLLGDLSAEIAAATAKGWQIVGF